jgi:tetratricopeptide (TPR) repeat protein
VAEPRLPDEIDLRELPRGVRAELRGLSPKAAEIVGAHLLMAGKLIDTDPELAYAHAEAARCRATRLPIAREAAGVTAYAAGEYEVALTELRAVRRMSGRDEYLPAIADCERALGNRQQALKLIKEGLENGPDQATRVELRLVEAGVRRELGQGPEGLRLLRTEIEQLGTRGSRLARARLRYGYADHLEASGETGEAEKWFATVVALDTDGATDAAERLAALQGLVIEFDENDEVDEGDEDAEADGGFAADDFAEDEDSVAADVAEEADFVAETSAAEEIESDEDADGAEEKGGPEDGQA